MIRPSADTVAELTQLGCQFGMIHGSAEALNPVEFSGFERSHLAVLVAAHIKNYNVRMQLLARDVLSDRPSSIVCENRSNPFAGRFRAARIPKLYLRVVFNRT